MNNTHDKFVAKIK